MTRRFLQFSPKRFQAFGTILILLCLNPLANADSNWPSTEVGATAAGFSEEGIAALDSAMKKIVADQDVAGMVWLLAKDGQVATFESVGLNSVETQTPMTKDSLFRIYSMTKPLTGVAMMMLYGWVVGRSWLVR